MDIGVLGILATGVVGLLGFSGGVLYQKKENEKLQENVNEQVGIIARALEESGLAEFNRDSYDKLVGIICHAKGKIEARSSGKAAGTVIKSEEKK